MSNALAIAGVTAVLRDLLNDGLINHNISGVLGSTVTVSILPPDRVVSADGEVSQLNLFLHRVTPNQGWRNEGLPSRGSAGRQQLSNPPLALDLHYILSAYSGAELHGEILLGYAMQLLHQTPVLTRRNIETALRPSPVEAEALPPALRVLSDSGLENQIEQIRITPEYLNTEEMSKLWTATQSHYRPTAGYLATVVLIQSTEPVRSPLPVLSRGPVLDPHDPIRRRETGVVVQPSLVPPVPMLEAVIPPDGQPTAKLGDTVELKGHHLDGTGHFVLLAQDRFEIEEPIVAATEGATLMKFSIPTERADDFPVGVYRVGARLQRPGDPAPRETSQLAMTLAPEIIGLPINVPAGTIRITLTFRPTLRPGQSVTLMLGQQEYAPLSFTAPTNSLEFDITHVPPGGHLARLRIDGIESQILNRTAEPPEFLNNRINIAS